MIHWPAAHFEAGKPGEKGLQVKTRIGFSVTKTDTSFANKATIKAWNLTRTTVSHIQKEGSVIRLFVSINGISHLIFTGDIDETRMTGQGADDILEIKTGDGEKKLKSVLDLSADRGQSWDFVFSQAAQALGVPLGTVRGIPPTPLKRGYSYSGLAKNLMDSLAKRFSLVWSVQNGVLQVLPSSESLKTSAVGLNKDTGLLGNLSKDVVKKEISGRSQLNPGITPGRILQITSARFGGVIDELTGKASGSGYFKTLEVTHSGDTEGSQWETKFRASIAKGVQ